MACKLGVPGRQRPMVSAAPLGSALKGRVQGTPIARSLRNRRHGSGSRSTHMGDHRGLGGCQGDDPTDHLSQWHDLMRLACIEMRRPNRGCGPSLIRPRRGTQERDDL